VLYGELEVVLEDRKRVLYPGDTVLVPRGVWHSFRTSTGVVFEELSTTHYDDDSFYEDKSIMRMAREERKTKLIHWGRHQFDDFDNRPAPSLEGAAQ
jgi:N-acetylneuraminate synthase